MDAEPEPSSTMALIRERILGFAISRSSRSDAEDLTQQVMIVLLSKYSNVSDQKELLPIAFGLLARLRMGLYRKRARRGEDANLGVEELQLASVADDPESRLARKELAEQLAAAIDRLNQRCQKMIRLMMEGHSAAYIQKTLGLTSTNAVYVVQSRCRAELRKTLSDSISQ